LVQDKDFEERDTPLI